ncbi:MAG: TMEM43 family protein, partial [Syntrophorhabdaceae bacterium]|nr:TMEM43 family protein [Syntrophorhabdaceae bacterium]
MMAYTETTSTGWFNRLGSSFRGIVFGLVLIAAGTALLWWNEGNFVGTGDALRQAQSLTQELEDISNLDQSKNGRLVHAVGPVATNDTLNDPIFGVSINAIRLEREVEFYQWIEQSKSEKKKKLGGGEETVTTYTYAQKWTNRPVDSSAFKDPQARTANKNIVLANMENLKAQATNVTFGAYRLPEFM